MDERAMIVRHLTQAEAHVVQGEEHIARQVETIARLERDHIADAAQKTARKLLATFEVSQESHLKDRARLRAELAEWDHGGLS